MGSCVINIKHLTFLAGGIYRTLLTKVVRLYDENLMGGLLWETRPQCPLAFGGGWSVPCGIVGLSLREPGFV